MHRFDGLDLLCLLIGLSLLGYIAWRIYLHVKSQEDPEPAQPRFMVGVDWARERSRIDAQLLVYQMTAHPDEVVLYAAHDEEQARSVHDEIERMWKEYHFRILNKPPYDWANDPDA